MVRLLKDKKEAVVTGEAVDAIELLKSQHREVEALFEEFEKLSERAGKSRMQIFEKIAHKLTCHARIEEKIFYPEGKSIDKDTTMEAFEEHDVVKSLIKKIAQIQPNDESFKAKMTVLKEIVQHHVEEEEGEFFPKMQKELGDERLKELGSEMKVMFDRLDAGHPEPKIRHLRKA